MTKQKNDFQQMLENNTQLVFRIIGEIGPVSRTQLAKITGLSATTVGKIITSLMKSDLVEEVGTTGNGIGRKATLVHIKSEGRYAIGIDLDIESISAGLINLNGKIIARRDIHIKNDLSPDGLANKIISIVDSLMTDIDSRIINKLIGIGVSMPGNVEWKTGNIINSPQFHWKNIPFREILSKYTSLPIFIENNVRSSAASEILFGHGKEYSDFVILHAGSGIGAAVVTNNVVRRGTNGLLGEIGHMTIALAGRKCDCGLHGCLQSYACISALEKISGLSYNEILNRAQNGDIFSGQLLNESSKIISMLVSNIVNIYDPPLILLSGKMFDTSNNLTNTVKKLSYSLMWDTVKNKPIIEKAFLSYNDNVILAAGSVVIQQLFLSPTLY